MKYTGTIVGFLSKSGSIYNIINDDSQCYAWKANIVAEINGKMLAIAFNWNGEAYELKLTLLKEEYYTGKIFCNREDAGDCFLWSFAQQKALLLKGDFVEDDSGNYDCFIELREFEQ